jgi:peroxiredoxin
MRRFLLSGLICLSHLLLLPSAPAVAFEVGKPAPDFRLSTTDGGEVALSDLRGRPIILLIGSVWCGACQQQSREIRYAEEYLAENRVTVVEVFINDTPAEVREHLVGAHWQHPPLALLADRRFAQAFGVYMIPRILLLDADLSVRFDGHSLTVGELVRKVGEILKKP